MVKAFHGFLEAPSEAAKKHHHQRRRMCCTNGRQAGPPLAGENTHYCTTCLIYLTVKFVALITFSFAPNNSIPSIVCDRRGQLVRRQTAQERTTWMVGPSVQLYLKHNIEEVQVHCSNAPASAFNATNVKSGSHFSGISCICRFYPCASLPPIPLHEIVAHACCGRFRSLMWLVLGSVHCCSTQSIFAGAIPLRVRAAGTCIPLRASPWNTLRAAQTTHLQGMSNWSWGITPHNGFRITDVGLAKSALPVITIRAKKRKLFAGMGKLASDSGVVISCAVLPLKPS